jgi:demethylmenaquinone methyltransferase/2-methoxy-6-polyprenyl-1,4-benzoquinol methylase
VVGVDFSESMLACAREKAARRVVTAPPEFVAGDLLELPFRDATFAAVTVAFGVRNVPDLGHAFGEMVRVTRPGGRVVCLEITVPPAGLGRQIHRLWFERAVPAVGAAVSGDGRAYTYLPASVRDFPPVEELAAVMSAAGLSWIRYRRLGLGMVALHVGTVDRPSEGRADR